METISYDGYNISMDSYCKAPLRISCSIGRYINSRLLLLLSLLLLLLLRQKGFNREGPDERVEIEEDVRTVK